MKKTFIILAFVVIFGLLGLTIIYGLNTTEERKNITEIKNEASINRDFSFTNDITNLSEETKKLITEASSTTTNSEPILKREATSSIQYYKINKASSSEEIFTVNAKGNLLLNNTLVSFQKIEKINEIQASVDKQKFLFSFNYPETSFSIFNLNNNSWQPLPQNTIAATFSPTDNNTVAILDKDLGLSLLNLKNKKNTPLLQLNLVNANLYWFEKNKLTITDKPNKITESLSFTYDLVKKSLQKFSASPYLMVNGNENWLLRFTNPNDIPNLSLFNQKTGKLISNFENLLNFTNSYTLPKEKCVFTGDNEFYCAIPTSFSKENSFPEGYLKKSAYSTDNFYKIIIDERNKSVVATLIFNNPSSEAIDARNISLVGDKLYFINAPNNLLYSLQLSEEYLRD